MTVKKAIILLYPSPNYDLDQLQESLITCCQEHNFEVSKIIIARGKHDKVALQRLIKAINEQPEPATLIIDRHSYTSRYTSVWCVLGTLLAVRQIDELRFYPGTRKELTDYGIDQFGILGKSKADFFLLSQVWLEHIESKIYELASFIKH